MVIFIVRLFLRALRFTVIPAVAIVVSLIGTFAFLYFVGMSVNMLTLFALVLVIGTVVDDAIVVVEAMQSRFDSGCPLPVRQRWKPCRVSVALWLPLQWCSWPYSSRFALSAVRRASSEIALIIVSELQVRRVGCSERWGIR